MKEDLVVKIKKSNIKRIGILDENNNSTGEFLEFDLEDLELPLKIAECEKKHKSNVYWLKNQINIINKKQNQNNKNIINKKQLEQINSFKEFYIKEMEALDLFLGENGTMKLLNGRKPYLSMYDDINEMLEPIMELLKETVEGINESIKNKYKNATVDSKVLK